MSSPLTWFSTPRCLKLLWRSEDSQGSNKMGEIVVSVLMTIIIYAIMIVAYKKGW